MTRTLFLAAAALAAASLAAGPALADTKLPTSKYRVKYDAKRDRYCVAERNAVPVTGTRIAPTECKTRTEWAKLGLEIEHRP